MGLARAGVSDMNHEALLVCGNGKPFAELSPQKVTFCSHGPSMKKAMKSSVMTASAAYSSVAETTGLKATEVKAVVEGLVEVVAGELKKNGNFKLAGALNLKFKK